MVEKTSRWHNIDSLVLLFDLVFMGVYNEKEQVEQKETQNVQFGEEENTRKLNVTAKACVKTDDVIVKISMVKERPPALHLRKVTLGQDLIQLCFQWEKRETLRNFLFLESK